MPSALSVLAASARGDGAVLVYSIRNVTVKAVASTEIAASLADYVAGNRPEDPRSARVLPAIDEGFRLDRDDFSSREIARDPFYQEFLRPRGFGWHACALLSETQTGEAIHLSIKRGMDRGPFSQSELTPLAAHLPAMRSAVRFTQAASAALGSLSPALPTLQRRSMVGFDSRGEAFAISGVDKDDNVVSIREGAISCASADELAPLSAAVERMRGGARQAAVLLTAGTGARWCFRFRRWPRDPETNLAFLGVLSPLDVIEEPSADWILMTRDLFGLSQAEARVAGLVGQGLTLPAVAQRLGLKAGTVRNQLKAVFAKTGVARQAELSVLLSRL